MICVEISEKLRRQLRELGRRARRDTALRYGNGDVKKGEKILKVMAIKHIRADGTKGDRGGRPVNRCAKSPEETLRHRYTKQGVCRFCGNPKR